MPEFCSCGAQLPPDALFCHKCGKAQREIVVPETTPQPEEAPVVAARPAAPPLNFHNPMAIRVALGAAGIAAILSIIPYVNIVCWLASGFFSVSTYRRRTGQTVNMESGVRMGWMTGVMTFAILTVLLTLWLLAMQNPEVVAIMQSKTAADPHMSEAFKLMQSGPGIASVLVQLFVFTTLLSMAGGALGAKITRRS